MGDKLVSELLPFMGAEVQPLAPLAYTEMIYNHLPYYLAIGMTAEQYLDGDCRLVKYYREADKLRQQRQNEMLWLQGMYVYDAILDASPVLAAFGGSEPRPYPDRPYAITKEEAAAREEERIKALIYEKRRKMIDRAAAINREFEEKRGDGNGNK